MVHLPGDLGFLGGLLRHEPLGLLTVGTLLRTPLLTAGLAELLLNGRVVALKLTGSLTVFIRSHERLEQVVLFTGEGVPIVKHISKRLTVGLDNAARVVYTTNERVACTHALGT